MNQEQVMAGKPFKKPLAILFMILLAILILFLTVSTWNQFKQHDYIGRSEQQIYTIMIAGEGKVTAVPDIAQLSLGIQTENKAVSKAQTENTEKMNQLIDKLKSMNIVAEDMSTASYNIYPMYDWTNGQSILRGYQVVQSLAVKIRNLEIVGDVVAVAGEIGANQIGGLNFTIDDPENLRQTAREKALLNAKQKAESLAKIAGVKLGRLVSFEESTSSPSPVYRDYAMEAKAVGGGGAVPDIEPGSQDIMVYVTVTYEVL